ncbi:hypothetical protein QOZ80_8BG0669190 [Eleusine coracana subsp. coracana]|nr:hypothetical protein QOZ80_8BG0669190 [Eleusine coracana subsp. coracana]
MWQSVGVGGVLQPPPKWSCKVIHTTTRRCKVNNNAGAESKCENEDESGSARRVPPSLPHTVRLRLAAFATTQRSDGGIRTNLFSLGDLKASASLRPGAHGVRSTDITMDASHGLWARVFFPAPASVTMDDDDDPLPLLIIVYFHGGGFVLFSAACRLYDSLCRRLCRHLRAVIVSVNYRLAPHHRFPAAYDDGVTALRYLNTNALSLSLPADLPVVDYSSCFIAGDSAGGNIAHHVAHRWASSMTSSSSSMKMTNLHIAGVVLIQPLFGSEERTAAELELANVCPILTLATADYCWREFFPEGASRDHLAAHVRGRDVDFESFPPVMMIVGGFDLLKDRHVRYVEELMHQEGRSKKPVSVRLVEYPDAIHGFYAFSEIADSGKFMEYLKLFIQEHKSSNN